MCVDFWLVWRLTWLQASRWARGAQEENVEELEEEVMVEKEEDGTKKRECAERVRSPR